MLAFEGDWAWLGVHALRHVLFKLLYPIALAATMAGLWGLWRLLHPRRLKGAKRWPLTLHGIIMLASRGRRGDQRNESARREDRGRSEP
ncbi:MAG: hypothetical protein HRF50_00295 [Phycisphaerae bacterium]|jgi:hypothetical protein